MGGFCRQVSLGCVFFPPRVFFLKLASVFVKLASSSGSLFEMATSEQAQPAATVPGVTEEKVDKEQVYQWILDLGDPKKREQSLLELRCGVFSFFGLYLIDFDVRERGGGEDSWRRIDRLFVISKTFARCIHLCSMLYFNEYRAVYASLLYVLSVIYVMHVIYLSMLHIYLYIYYIVYL